MEETDFCCVNKNSGKPSYFNNFWMVVVKNGHGVLVPRTLAAAVFQE